MTTTGETPEAETVILAVLAEVVVFCVYVAVTDPLPEPEGVTVHHDWLLTAFQAVFDATVKAVLPAGAVTFWVDGVTISTGVAPACVTVTTTGESPLTMTVTLATLAVNNVFSVKVAVMVPLLLPEGVTVHHPWLLATVQPVLETTLNVVEPAAAPTF